MKIGILMVGRGGSEWALEAVNDYARRLKRAHKVEEICVRAERYRGDVDLVRAGESERLLAKVGPRDRLVVLDERGDDLDTPGMVQLFTRYQQQGATRLLFALGGPYGHSPELRKRAWRVVRLSSLVLNHDVARVVLYEQLYRATAIMNGIPYHH